MKLEVTNANYCASVVELKQFYPIENKDKIQSTLIFSNNVIVAKTCNIGDIGIYFPVECKINSKFLSTNNIYKDSELNVDKTLKGFFETNGRVKALKLGGVKSEGFFIPLKSLDTFCDVTNLKVGYEFNNIDGVEICSKYVAIQNHRRDSNGPGKGKNAKLKQFNKLIENQFSFHIDTPVLNKNIHRLNPDDVISISNKLHGTSAIFSNVLINKQLTTLERILKFFKVRINDVEYGNIYASRAVVKNKFINKQVTAGFYNEDIWGVVNEEIKSKIPKGYTIYGEIVGFLGSGKCIQKGYHYGCKPNTHKLYVYRVTNTNPDGYVVELGWLQLKEFCKKYELDLVPEFYFGYAKDVFPDIKIDENWNVEFLKRLQQSYNMNDSKCELCNKEVPAEGLVVRIESLYKFNVFKLKNFAFNCMESKQNDENVVDIETAESLQDSE